MPRRLRRRLSRPPRKLEILAVPGNIENANAITGTVKYMTDTAVGPKTATVALFSSGLPNVPISVPVHLSVTPSDPASKVMTATWTLTAPDGSKAKIKDSKPLTVTEFTPDLVGAYKVDVVLRERQRRRAAGFRHPPCRHLRRRDGGQLQAVPCRQGGRSGQDGSLRSSRVT